MIFRNAEISDQIRKLQVGCGDDILALEFQWLATDTRLDNIERGWIVAGRHPSHMRHSNRDAAQRSNSARCLFRLERLAEKLQNLRAAQFHARRIRRRAQRLCQRANRQRPRAKSTAPMPRQRQRDLRAFHPIQQRIREQIARRALPIISPINWLAQFADDARQNLLDARLLD